VGVADGSRRVGVGVSVGLLVGVLVTWGVLVGVDVRLGVGVAVGVKVAVAGRGVNVSTGGRGVASAERLAVSGSPKSRKNRTQADTPAPTRQATINRAVRVPLNALDVGNGM
jgi:hypothetical protein